MTTIWKYPLLVQNVQMLHDIPHEAFPLCIQLQGNVPTLWMLVNPAATIREEWTINLFGTGHRINDEAGEYIGTVQREGFVWHYFVGDIA